MENKIVLSFTADKVTDEANTTIVGNGLDLMVAYIELSKALLKKMEETGGEWLARGFYATAQKQVIEESCLKESFDEHVADMERIRPLMSILGKTFKMPDKDGEAK